MTTTVVRLKRICSLLKKSNIIILLFTATLVFSCQTNLQKMDELVKEIEEPVVISEDVEWFYTKQGTATHRLTSPKVLRFEGQKGYIEFPRALKFFLSTLTENKRLL